MKRLYVAAITATCTVAVIVFAEWALLRGLNFRASPDGLMLLNSGQVAECDNGGGCAIFSARELQKQIAEHARKAPPV